MTLFRKNSVPVRKATHSPRNFWDMALGSDDIFGPLMREWPGMKNSLEMFSPAIDVKENDQEYLIEAEFPGVDKKDIDVSIKDRNICLKGEKKTFNEEKKEDYHHMERTYGSFFRTIPLAGDADPERVSADFENGLLKVSVAKKQSGNDSSRKVDIR